MTDFVYEYECVALRVVCKAHFQRWNEHFLVVFVQKELNLGIPLHIP